MEKVAMKAPNWSSADSAKAKQLWAEYQEQHDVADRKGQAVGIDPHTGEVWFGASAKDIWLALEAQGKARPLFYARVGQPTYGRMGART
jgi:hypothetical protein